MGHFDELLVTKLVASEIEVNTLDFAEGGGKKVSSIKGTVAVTATAAANSDLNVGTQPANSSILNLYVIPQAAFTTAGGSGDDLDISVGTAAGGGEIIAAKALMDDGGSAVSAKEGQVLAIIDNGRPAGSNAFSNDGPATSELMALAAHGILHTNTARDIHVRFTPLANDLAATGSMLIVCEFVHDA
tara:strand:+ start:640 stop:1200 length:561 start_codon:yes stop_codon:yes gene_type:complete